mmetsp:Transcript_3307/g.6895  ORF Transcript_3307/g.6895 Transcript_3307/m.6895 type:complete len:184 (-) Transcript_3307:250-801(-)
MMMTADTNTHTMVLGSSAPSLRTTSSADLRDSSIDGGGGMEQDVLGYRQQRQGEPNDGASSSLPRQQDAQEIVLGLKQLIHKMLQTNNLPPTTNQRRQVTGRRPSASSWLPRRINDQLDVICSVMLCCNVQRQLPCIWMAMLWHSLFLVSNRRKYDRKPTHRRNELGRIHCLPYARNKLSSRF